MSSLQSDRPRALIVERDALLRERCASTFRDEGFEIRSMEPGREACGVLEREPFDVALLGLPIPDEECAELARICAPGSGTRALIMMGSAPPGAAVEALRERAAGYLSRSFTAEHLRVLLSRTRLTIHRGDPARVGSTAREPLGGGEPLGGSPSFLRVLRQAERVAPTDASVFLSGESGSGKELLAQHIHRHSRRAGRRMVVVNCAALPESLLESELFGHVRGAFTGAFRDKAGLLETADGGTFFLDELTEMSPTVQAKLLRFVQDGIIRRVGSEHSQAKVDVRLIASTNRDLRTAVRAGVLRKDLYYRLSVVPIHVPPLRERIEDIPVLAEHFLRTYWRKHKGEHIVVPILAKKAIEALKEHAWAGNVRQLQNVIEHAVVLLEPGRVVHRADLPGLGETPGTRRGGSAGRSGLAVEVEGEYHTVRDRVLAEFELHYLRKLIDRAGANVAQAAKVAGVNRTTLYRLMDKHGMRDIIVSVGGVARSPSAVPED